MQAFGRLVVLETHTLRYWEHHGNVIVPFIRRKNGTLTARQQCYNGVHRWYRARIEQLFARLWHWGLVRNIWHGGPDELHQ